MSRDESKERSIYTVPSDKIEEAVIVSNETSASELERLQETKLVSVRLQNHRRYDAAHGARQRDEFAPLTIDLDKLFANSKDSLTKLKIDHEADPTLEQLSRMDEWAPNLTDLCFEESIDICQLTALALAAARQRPIGDLDNHVDVKVGGLSKLEKLQVSIYADQPLLAPILLLLSNLPKLTNLYFVLTGSFEDPRDGDKLCDAISNLPLKELTINREVWVPTVHTDGTDRTDSSGEGKVTGLLKGKLAETLEVLHYWPVLEPDGPQDLKEWEGLFLPGVLDQCKRLKSFDFEFYKIKDSYLDALDRMTISPPDTTSALKEIYFELSYESTQSGKLTDHESKVISRLTRLVTRSSTKDGKDTKESNCRLIIHGHEWSEEARAVVAHAIVERDAVATIVERDVVCPMTHESSNCTSTTGTDHFKHRVRTSSGASILLGVRKRH